MPMKKDSIKRKHENCKTIVGPLISEEEIFRYYIFNIARLTNIPLRYLNPKHITKDFKEK